MEQRPAIFKLNLDCFDHVFDYLGLQDLGVFSQTCKAMKAAVGEYYQVNCGTIEKDAGLGKEDLCLHENTMGYSDFVQKLFIRSLRHDDDFGVKRDSSRKVMELTFMADAFTKPELHRLEYILNNAKVLNIHCGCHGMSESMYETLPGMCNSLKRLHIKGFEYTNAAQTQDGNKWLLREYPTLEHLEWTQTRKHGYKINEIKEFFKRNPNVRSFATNVQCLWKSHHLIIESGVKLNDLTIEGNRIVFNDNPQRIKNACILLNELYKKAVYKRLHLKFLEYGGAEHLIQQAIDQIIPINAVRSINLMTCPNVNFSKLVNLVELQIFSIEGENVDMLTSQLVNLERVNIFRVALEGMLPFIYHLVKLKKLKVTQFRDRNVSALDLANMNKRREQLLDATKVMIFIEERFYLATKWALKLTEFRLIEMRRKTAHEWGHHFGIY